MTTKEIAQKVADFIRKNPDTVWHPDRVNDNIDITAEFDANRDLQEGEREAIYDMVADLMGW